MVRRAVCDRRNCGRLSTWQPWVLSLHGLPKRTRYLCQVHGDQLWAVYLGLEKKIAAPRGVAKIRADLQRSKT